MTINPKLQATGAASSRNPSASEGIEAEVVDQVSTVEYGRMLVEAAATLQKIVAKRASRHRLTPREKASLSTGLFWASLRPLDPWQPPPHLDPAIAFAWRALLLSCLRDIVNPSPTAITIDTKDRRAVATYGRHGSMPIGLNGAGGKPK